MKEYTQEQIENYIKQSREELDGAIWDGDALYIFWMLEQVYGENKELREALEKIKNEEYDQMTISDSTFKGTVLKVAEQALKEK